MSQTPIYTLAVSELRGGSHTVRAGAHEIVIVTTADGLRVYDGVCPHLGGPLVEGTITPRAIVCPWHRYVFDSVSGRCRTVPGTVWRSICPEAKWMARGTSWLPMNVAISEASDAPSTS